MRERLKEKLAELWPELDDRRRSRRRRRGARAVRRCIAPHVAFLDIRMPGRNGLDVAAAIGGDCHVVFITAYDQYAIKAFDAGAVDYLLKPVEADRLAHDGRARAAASSRRRRPTCRRCSRELRATLRTAMPRD